MKPRRFRFVPFLLLLALAIVLLLPRDAFAAYSVEAAPAILATTLSSP